jgi:hypothetical protein
MRTLAMLVLLLSAAACARGESTDHILYRPLIERVDGTPVSRVLLVTPSRGALLVTRRFDDTTRVAAADVSESDWGELRRSLSRTRYFPSEAYSPRESPPTFLLRGRLGQVDVDLERDPEEPVEREVVRARAVLDRILAAMPAEADPVADASLFLESPSATVRRVAVDALRAVRDDELRDEEVRRAAGAALRAHARVEPDRRIVDRIGGK